MAASADAGSRKARDRWAPPGRVPRASSSLHWPGNLFPRSPFNVKGTWVQVSPCDELCFAGQVTIEPGSKSGAVEISGELFTLRPKASC
jgi:hypothetical protein